MGEVLAGSRSRFVREKYWQDPGPVTYGRSTGGIRIQIHIGEELAGSGSRYIREKYWMDPDPDT